MILNEIIPRAVLLVIGLHGNTIQYIVFSQKSLMKLTSHNIYRVLAVQDSLYLLFSVVNDILVKTNVYKDYDSLFVCKLISVYFNFSFSPISAWLLVYISIDRYLSIKHSSFILARNKLFQIFIICLVYLYNLGYYAPLIFYTKIIETTVNSTKNDSSLECKREYFFYIMDLVNLAVLPFCFMLLSSILLTQNIFKSRLKLLRSPTNYYIKKIRKDIIFCVSCLLQNMVHFLFTLSVGVIDILQDVDQVTIECIYLIYYMGYSVNFFILFASHSIFRGETIKLFNKKLRCKTVLR